MIVDWWEANIPNGPISEVVLLSNRVVSAAWKGVSAKVSHR